MITIGIDIGSASIKLVMLEGLSKGYKIKHSEVFPLNVDPTKDQDVEILDTLRNIEIQYRELEPKYVVAISQAEVATRQIEFPFKEKHKILKSVAFELDEELPFNQETAIYDAKILHYEGAGAKVFASVAPKEAVQKNLDRHLEVGIDPEVISSTGMALSGVFEDWEALPPEVTVTNEDNPPLPEENQAVVYLDIGHRNSTAILYKDDRLVDIYTLSFGGHHMASAMVAEMNMHYLEAAKVLRTKAAFALEAESKNADEAAISKALFAATSKFGNQMRLVLLDLESQYQVTITQVILTGGCSQIKNIGAAMTQFLLVPTNPVANLKMHPQFNLGAGQEHKVELTTAFGLALEGLRKPKNPATNFLKDEFRKDSKAFTQFWLKWSHTLQVTAAAFVVFLIFSILRDQLALEMTDRSFQGLKKQATTVAKLVRNKANARNVKKYIREQEKIEKSREAAENLQNLSSSLDIIKQISEIAPNQKSLRMDIKRVIVDFENVSIEAQTSSPKWIPAFQNALKSLARKGRVEKFKSNYPGDRGKTVFGLRFKTNIRSEEAE